MGKIDNNYDYLFLNNNCYDFRDKEKNIKTDIKYMLNRTCIMFKYHGLPNTITSENIEKLIQSNGYGIFTIINNDYYIVYGGLGGECDIYNEPTIATVSVPYFNYNANLEIGKECVIIPCDNYKIGLYPLINKYCSMLCDNEITMSLETINNRVQSFISANNDTTLESAKQFLKNIENGNLGVIAEEQLFSSLNVHNSTTNTKIKDLYEYQQYLKGTLYNELGLNANYNMKRERLTSADVELNSDGLYPLIDSMLNCRKTAINKINDLYGLNISVELNSSWDYRILNGKSIHDSEIEESEIEESEIEESEIEESEIEESEIEESEIEKKE